LGEVTAPSNLSFRVPARDDGENGTIKQGRRPELVSGPTDWVVHRSVQQQKTTTDPVQKHYGMTAKKQKVTTTPNNGHGTHTNVRTPF